ncbi:MAG: HNH endonuclease [Myxococcales bacterium]|nr:HNH endonuclease [Myxococcales bacterium]MBK7195248.1 HNH endonuclease [Myxococcales bacterium]MBP6846935.1 HNH endonuclease [Kofleriaceae bacterium]
MVDGAVGGQKVGEAAAAAAVAVAAAVAAGAAGAAGAAAAADDWRVVDRTLRGLARRRAALDVEEAAWLRRARALGVHRELGFASFFEYVERVLGYAPGPARERLRVADALAALPKLRAAMSAGDVAYSAARELTRVATVDTEAAWLTAAAKHTVREIEDMVSGRRRGDSPDDPPDPAARLHELRLLLPAAVLGKFTAARRALEAACGHPLTDGDLLATLCDGQLAGSHAGDAGAGSHTGDAAVGAHVEDAAATSKPMYQIAITRCPDCTRAWQDVAGHTIEISETELAQASCDAELLGRVDGDKPARVTKTIPPRTRRAVLRRDRGRCVVPGCRNARYVDVHHIVPRAAGGKHTPSKLSVLCSAHHKAAHDGRLRVEGTAPGKLRFTHADGRPYGAPPPSHVGDGDAAAPPAGGEVPVAPSQVSVEAGAPPAARRRRRTKAPPARRTRGSSKAGGR